MMKKSYLKCEKCENRSMFEEKNKKTLAMFKEHKNVHYLLLPYWSLLLRP